MASFPLPFPLPFLNPSSASSQEAHPHIPYEVVPLVPEGSEDVTAQSQSESPPQSSEMGYDEQILKPEGRDGDRAALYAAFASVAVFLVSTLGIVLANDPASLGLFLWHPVLQSLAIALFTYGILTLQPTSQPRTKAAGLTRHQTVILFMGAPVLVLGTLAIVVRKFMHGANHFTTWHGTIGIVSVVWMVAQIAVGGGSVWFDGRLFGGNPKAKMMWKYHRASGYVLFPVFLFTAYLGGAWSNWSTERSPAAVRYLAYTVAPLILLGAVLSRVRLSKMRFF